MERMTAFAKKRTDKGSFLPKSWGALVVGEQEIAEKSDLAQPAWSELK